MKLKNLLFVLLALALVLSLGVCAAAEGGDAPEVVLSGTLELGNAQYTFYSDGNLVLEGSGPVYGTFMDEPMEPYFNDIKTLTVGEGITSLNGLVFTNCKNLETVKLPKSFHITEDNFMNCSHLKRFIVDPDNPNHAADAAGALYNKAMTVLYKYVTGSPATAYTVANGTEVIWECAFSGCASLETVTLPNSVTTIQNEAFNYCPALREINLPYSLTSLGGNAFFNCRSLQRITLPDQLSEIQAYTFMQCYGMTSISIPACLRKIGFGAFQSCTALTDVYIMMDENTWNNEVTVAGQNDYLLAATPHFLAPSLLKSGYCGQGGDNATYKLYSNGLLMIEGTGLVGKIARDHTGPLGEYDYVIKDVVIGEGIDMLEYAAFNGCPNLETVTLSKTFSGGNARSFCYCPSLKRFIVDEENPYLTVDENGCLFSKDMTVIHRFPPGSALTEYEIPDSVTRIGIQSFYSCVKLEKVFVPDSVTAMEFAAFDRCLNLKEARIPSGVTYFGWAVFSSCTKLQEITIPEHFTEIPPSAFQGCESLQTVSIPKNVTKIGETAFSNCIGLKEIYLHDGITEFGAGAFRYCDSLEYVRLPNHLTEIPSQMFMDDWSLKQITIPSNVRTIGERAFGSDPGINRDPLTNVYIMMSEETWNNEVSVADYNERLLNATLHFLPEDNDGYRWASIPTLATGLKKGDLYLDFSDYAAQTDEANKDALLAALNAGEWLIDKDAAVLKGTYTISVVSSFSEERWISPNESKPVLVSALREAGVTWITLPYGTDGLQDGDWYLDLDLFVEAEGHDKTEAEKQELRNLLLQYVTFYYNPNGNYFVYRFDYNNLPIEGDKISGSTILPIHLMLGEESAFSFENTALQHCVKQYQKPADPQKPEEKPQSESWIDRLFRPVKSAISSILSFFRKLFKKTSK